ncbi:MAG: helix-turn-helix domain containing protein [Clostridiales bacterium]|nr:helix-turn-helix domain containing protein [Clostridiales bacterium]
MFYDNVKAACTRKGTNITTVLTEIGRATGNTGTWKLGKYPRLDLVMEMAEHLGVSVDELAYGKGQAPYADQTQGNEIDDEWVDIITHIPEDRQQMCKDFLRTHMVIPEKYADGKKA